ncbi:hypothetical protein GM3709_2373 [Geminocystis sp. NIES-3709]|nr:hypothetical protein GM3709_2373 [Geminocystis sp. NIES-3709]
MFEQVFKELLPKLKQKWQKRASHLRGRQSTHNADWIREIALIP